MSVITIFSGTFCNEDSIVREVIGRTGYKLVAEKELVAEASKVSGMAENKIKGAFSAKTSVFNKFTHEKERSTSYLRLCLAKILFSDNLLIAGFAGQLIPKNISHVLRVCLIADMKFRTSVAFKEKGLPQKEATKLIHKQDEDRIAWNDSIFRNKDPWDASLYDIVIPVDKMSIEEAASLIVQNVRTDVVKPTESSKKATQDFLLAANVGNLPSL
jgi:two-component system response regulator CpxR